MLDQLIKIITKQGEQDVIQNPSIPHEYNNQILGEAGNSIFSGLQQALAGGGLGKILSMLRGAGGGQSSGLGGLLNNPLVQNIIQSFAGKLTSQYNLSPQVAQNVGASLIPQVLSNLAGKVNDPNDNSIDMNQVIQSLTGGQAGNTDFNSLADRFSGMGGDVDGDGDVDMQDIIASVSGAARKQQGSSSGIMDMIGSFLR